MKGTEGMEIASIWFNCRKMWEWITSELKKSNSPLTIGNRVEDLKWDWCEDHDYYLKARCFFCDWACRVAGSVVDFCSHCPGRDIDPEFNCQCKEYDYGFQPYEFCQKIVEMDKKRVELYQRKK